MPRAAGLMYEDVGSGEPVLLIHGGAIANAFLPLTREPSLVERYRLIRYHRRGFGGSDPLSRPYTLSGAEHWIGQVQDALSLLGALDIDRAHVVGHSGGGLIAVQLALDSPQAVHSLVLMEPALVTMKPSWAKASSEALAPMFELYKESPREAAETLLSAVEGRRWREFADTFPGGSDQWLKDTIEMFFEFPAALDWSFDANDGDRISQPVLHITGANSPPYVESLKELFRSWVPQSEGVVIPEAWHGMHMRQPGAVAHEIADFLARHTMVT